MAAILNSEQLLLQGIYALTVDPTEREKFRWLINKVKQEAYSNGLAAGKVIGYDEGSSAHGL